MSPAAEFGASGAGAKRTTPAVYLVARAVPCNWLVCLAVWLSTRPENDAAKCIASFGCLEAFIAGGFEPGGANLTLPAPARFGPHGDAVTWFGGVHHLVGVTGGNVIGARGSRRASIGV